MYGRAPLALTLSAMAEVDERLRDTQTTRDHLLSIKRRAQKEIEALEVVQRVEEAKATLTKLKAGIGNGKKEEDQTARQQIFRLEGYITQYSKQAERAIITAGQVGETR